MSPVQRGQPYRARVLDTILANRLASSGAVLLEGPKASGKTYTAEQASGSQVFLDTDRAALTALEVDPALVLDPQRPPLLIDEWQLAATPVWNHVRDVVNRRGTQGLFILTGSAVPADDETRHTGAGRFARLRLRPMSLFESGESSGVMSLAELLSGARPASPRPLLTISDIVDLTVRGGWPMNLRLSITAAARANRDYLKTIAEVDLKRVDPARNDPHRANRLLRALARNTAMEYKVARIAAEAATDDETFARRTVYEYAAAFDRLMITEMQPPWATHLRSRARLRTADRIHFVDPSLAVAALAASSAQLLQDLNTFGYLFESLVVRDCRVYADASEATVYHYRDSDDLEVDLVVVAGDRWGALEVKLGESQVDEAAANLVSFARKIDTDKIGRPAFLGVVTGSSFGYTRKNDGVVVIPVGAFGP